MKVHVSLRYHELAIDDLPSFALGVKTGIYTHDPSVVIDDAPMSLAEFQLHIAAFINTRATYEAGRLAHKGDFLRAHHALMQGLDKLAAFVEDIADGNEVIIILSC